MEARLGRMGVTCEGVFWILNSFLVFLYAPKYAYKSWCDKQSMQY